MDCNRSSLSEGDRRLNAAQIASLAHRYRQAAENTGGADVVAGNQSNDEMHEAYKLLRSTPQGRQAIQDLITDANPRVRCWAASHTLFWAPDAGRAALESLVQADGPSAFDAKMTLREFDAGRLSFDY